jgi:isoamylase
LVDPHAKAILGRLEWHPALFGYRKESGDDLTFDDRDSAAFVPRCRVIDPAFTWGEDRPLHTPWERTIIYELHGRGSTMLHPQVPKPLRGMFRGLSEPPVLEHRRRIGVTAVELLPVHTFIDDSHLTGKGLVNYWGYNTNSFFAPPRNYASVPDFAFAEFKEMVARFHAAGIEVILDVVYNHTAEGDELGPTLSFRGIDNASYYRLLPDRQRYYINDTGIGNTLNLSHARVLQMVTDSLRYWAQEMHVDGFRFDLATILARQPYGFDQGGRISRFLPAGPGLVLGQAHRRTLGLRSGRLSGRRFSAGLGRMERPFSRHGASVLEGRRGQAGRLRHAPHRLCRFV